MKQFVLLLASVGLLTGCVSKSSYQDLQTQLAKTQEEVKTLTDRNQQLESSVENSQSTLVNEREAREAIEQQCADLAASKSKLEEQTQTYKDLVQNLEKEISAGEVTISEMKDKLTVNVVDKILFDSGKSQVKKGGEKTLQKVAEVLKSIHDKRIQVNGHTDDVPIGKALADRFPTNWELSTARATSVVRMLAHMGVGEDKMSAAGFSKFNPVAPNSDESGRQKNRRIEIVLVPDAGDSETLPAPE